MGIGATQDLAFETEEAREKALNEVPEIPENEEKIDSILKAPIKPKEGAAKADDKPAEKPPESTDSAKKTEPVPEPKTEAVSAGVGGADEVFTIKKADLLAKGHSSLGSFLKSFDEANDTIKRQQTFIKDKLTNSPQDQAAKTVLERAEKAERELEELKKKSSSAPQAPTPTQKDIVSSQSRLADIQKLKDELAQADAFDEKTIEKRRQLDNLYYEEISRLSGLVTQQMQEINAAKETSARATQEVADYKKSQDADRQSKEANEALLRELESIDKFCGNPAYPEFKMSKSSRDVEADYLAWGKSVASLFRGADVNVYDREGRAFMKVALDMLGKGAPDIIEKCKLAGVAIAPTDDIRKYLDICDLLDYRDGLRYNPATGKKEVVQRFHPPSGSYIPDAFPSIEAAYENRKIVDGVYAQKIADQYRKGGSDALAAVAKRDNGIVELDNVMTSKDGGATFEMTTEKAAETIANIDEAVALREKNDGKPELFNQLMEAYKVLGIAVDNI